MPAVFISYSRRDKDFVARLHDALAERQYDVWVDWEDIPPSAEWFKEIESGVGQADGFVFVISPDSVASEVCRRELDHAVASGKRLVPVLHRDPNGVAVPPAAADRNWVFLREEDDFDAGLERLAAALETDLEHVRTHTRLGVAAARWEASGRDASQLLRGSDLSAAEAWLVGGGGREPEATQLQREFLLASRQAATRRQRSVIAAVSFALVVAIALAVVALIQRSSAIHERNVALTRQLDADAINSYSTDPELSVLLARKAVLTVANAASIEALRQALARSHVRVRYEVGSQSVGDALWSPDGTRLLVTSLGHWARIYRPGTSAAPVVLQGQPAARGTSSWDARGNRIIVGGGAHGGVYDAITGRRVAALPGPVLYTALNADGTLAVVTDLHGVGSVVDVGSGRVLARLHPTYSNPGCLALSPDGRYVVECDTASLSGTVAPSSIDVFATATGRLEHTLRPASAVEQVTISPDSRWVAFPVPATGAFVYDLATGRLLKRFPDGASAVAFGPKPEPTDPRGQLLAYATLSGHLGHIYGFGNGQSLDLFGAGDVVTSIRFDTAGTYVVEAGRDGSAEVFDASGATGSDTPAETLAGDSADVVDAGFGLDDQQIATVSDDGTVRVWAGLNPQPLANLPQSAIGPPSIFSGLVSTPSGSRVVGVQVSGHGVIADGSTMRSLATFAAPRNQLFAGEALSNSGAVLATLSGPAPAAKKPFTATTAEVFDPRTGRLLHTIEPGSPTGLSNTAVSYDGTRIVTLDNGGGADVWNAGTGAHLFSLPGSGPATGLAVSRDGSLIAIAHYPPGLTSAPVRIDVWNATGHLLRSISADPLTPQLEGTKAFATLALDFSPDGGRLALAGAAPDVAVFDPRSGKRLATLDLQGRSAGPFADSVAFSPDGTWLAAGAASGLYVWRGPNFSGPSVLNQAPVGTAGTLVGLDGMGVFLSWTPDSQELLSIGDVHTKLWDPATGMQLFSAYPGVVAALGPGGSNVYVGTGGGIARYRCELCGGLPQLLAQAGRQVTRDLSAAERARYLGSG